MDSIPTDNEYEGKELLSKFRHRRNWPISEPPEIYKRSYDPSVVPGQLVKWARHPDEDEKPGWSSKFYAGKRIGVVLKTRWVLNDWDYDKRDDTLYPEALVLWGDGGTTNSSHNSLHALEKDQER